MQKKIIRIILITVVILLVPFISNWPWTVSDFIAAGILLLGAGLGYVFATRKALTTKHRIITGSLIIIVLLLVWVELAVGLFGTPFAGN